MQSNSRRQLKRRYVEEYWEGVRSGKIRRGVKFRTFVVSHKGEPLRFDVVYEDSPFYPYARMSIG